MAIHIRCKQWSLILLLSAVAAVALADDPAGQGAKKPRVRVTISKETTYITEPLRPDGYPDYVAALNLRCSEGVTPENNAAVLFWQAVGPGEIPAKIRQKYFQMLGIPPLPEEGKYLVATGQWVKLKQTKPESETSEEEDYFLDPLWEQQTQTMQRPWSKEEFPVWAEWLAVNEKPLATLIEASRRPRWFAPLVPEENDTLCGSIGSSLGVTMCAREASRVLAARAMFLLHEGRIDEAWESLLAGHRLARHVGRGPLLIDMLVSIAIDGIAHAGDRALLQHVNLTAAQAAKMRSDLQKLPLMPKAAEVVNYGERLFGLDSTVTIAREGLGSLDMMEPRGKPRNLFESMVKDIDVATLDGDLLLTFFNRQYNRMAEAFNQLTRAERIQALDTLTKELSTLQKSAGKWLKFLILALENPREARSQQLAETLAVLFLPALAASVNAEDRAIMQLELTRLAFALAEYRAEHGAYPTKLAELTPKYITEVPKDIFSDAELHYRPEGDGYLLYSVGINGTDDGGKGHDDRKDYEQDDWDDLVVRMPAAKSPPAETPN